jgi:Flp pilus assembly protein TadD
MGELLQELAAQRVDQLQRVAPDSAAVRELVGKSLEARGKLEEALAQYWEALKIAPGAPGLHFLIGNIDWKLRKLGEAESECAEELKMNPHHAMANFRMGQIQLEIRRDEPMRAVAFLREAVSGTNSSLEAHRDLGKALRLAHRYQEAVIELEFVESKAPNDDSVHAQLAALYKDLGDRDRARREIEIHSKILRERLQASQKAHTVQQPQ